MQESNDDARGGFAEHRRSWREPIVASALLTAVGVSGAAGQRVVRVVNLSEGGVGLVAPAMLATGSEYDLQITGRPDRSGPVRVIFCRPTLTGFDVGAEYLKSPKERETQV